MSSRRRKIPFQNPEELSAFANSLLEKERQEKQLFLNNPALVGEEQNKNYEDTFLGGASRFGKPFATDDGLSTKMGHIGDSQYDNEVNPYNEYNINEIRADKQGFVDKLGNSLAQFSGNALVATSGLISIPFGIFEGIRQDEKGKFYYDGSKIIDNTISRSFDSLNKTIQENTPFYLTQAEKDAPLVGEGASNYWFSWNFVLGKVVNNLGYTAGAFSSGMGVGKLFQSVGKIIAANQIAKVGEIAKDLVNTGKALSQEEAIAMAIDKVGGTIKNLDRTTQILARGAAVAGEATTEAINIKDETYKSLSDDLKTKKFKELYGREPVENEKDLIILSNEEVTHLKDLSVSAGNVGFALNSAILSVSDGLQWAKAFKGFNVSKELEESIGNKLTRKFLTKEALEELGKVKGKEVVGEIGDNIFEVSKLFRDTKLGKVISRIKSPMTEMTEEQLQFATQKGTEDYYRKKQKGKDWWNNFSSSVVEGFTQAYGTKEGWENGILGFITGGLTGGVLRLANLSEEKDKDTLLNARLQSAAEILNKHLKSNQYGGILKSITDEAASMDDLKEAVDTNDIRKFKNIQWDNFVEYIIGRIQAGKFDILKEELTDLLTSQLGESARRDELAALGIYDTGTITKYVNKLLNEANKIKESYDNVDRLYGKSNGNLGFTGEKNQDIVENITNDKIKSTIFNAVVNYENRDYRIKELINQLTELTKGQVLYEPPLANETEEQNKERINRITDSVKKWEKENGTIENGFNPLEHLENVKKLHESNILNDLEQLNVDKQSNLDLFNDMHSAEGQTKIKNNIKKEQEELNNTHLELGKKYIASLNTKEDLDTYLTQLNKSNFTIGGIPVTTEIKNKLKEAAKIKQTAIKNKKASEEVKTEIKSEVFKPTSTSTNNGTQKTEEEEKEEKDDSSDEAWENALKSINKKTKESIIQYFIDNVLNAATNFDTDFVERTKEKIENWQKENPKNNLDFSTNSEKSPLESKIDSKIETISNFSKLLDFKKEGTVLTQAEITLIEILFQEIAESIGIKQGENFNFTQIASYIYYKYGEEKLKNIFDVLKYVYAGTYSKNVFKSEDISNLPFITVDKIGNLVKSTFRANLTDLEDNLKNEAVNVFIDGLKGIEFEDGIAILSPKKAEIVDFLLNKIKIGDKVVIKIDTEHPDYEKYKNDINRIPLKIVKSSSENSEESKVAYLNILPHEHAGIVYLGEDTDLTQILQNEENLKELEKYWYDLTTFGTGVTPKENINNFYKFINSIINVNKTVNEDKLDATSEKEEDIQKVNAALNHIKNIVTFGSNNKIGLEFNKETVIKNLQNWEYKIRKDILYGKEIRKFINGDVNIELNVNIDYKSTGTSIKSRKDNNNIIFRKLNEVLDDYPLLHSGKTSSLNLISVDGSNREYASFTKKYNGLFTLIKSAKINSDGTIQYIPVALVNNTIRNYHYKQNQNDKDYRAKLTTYIAGKIQEAVKLIREKQDTSLFEQELAKTIIVGRNNFRVVLTKDSGFVTFKSFDINNNERTVKIELKEKSETIYINGINSANNYTKTGESNEATKNFNEVLTELIHGMKRNVNINTEKLELNYQGNFKDEVDGTIYPSYKDYLIQTGAIITDLGVIKDEDGNKISNISPTQGSPVIINISLPISGQRKVSTEQQINNNFIITDTFEELAKQNNLNSKYDWFFKLADDSAIKLNKIINENSEGFAQYKDGIVTINSKINLANNPTSHIVHEIIHGLIDLNINNENYAIFNKKLEEFFKSIVNVKTDNEIAQAVIDLIRANAPLEEIVTYAFSNPEFAAFLDSIESTKKSDTKRTFLDDLKDIIREFIKDVAKQFNYTKLDELNDLVNEFFNNDKPVKNEENVTQPIIPKIKLNLNSEIDSNNSAKNIPNENLTNLNVQIKTISEEEINEIIKNEVTYTDEEGKPCAEKGGRTSIFTKGSKWSIVKDLKGYPTHAQGGVDIKLGKDGFSFTGKNGEIKAKHGLVLPKIK